MSTDTASRPSRDLVFDLLSSPRRRMVLYYLRQHGSATVSELAEEIAARENDTDVESLTKQQQKRVYVSLYQTHVPKLADAGIVEYDQDSGEVALTSQATDLETYLEPDSEDDYPWHYHYLVLATVSGVLFLLAVAAVPPFATVSTSLLGGAVVVAFAASGIAQYVSWRRRRERSPREFSEDSL